MNIQSRAMAAFALGLAFFCTTVKAIPIGFEGYMDSYALTDEIAGVSFSGGTVLTAGVGLNEIDYPPTSGLNVLAALSGSLTVKSNVPISFVAANFTFADTLTFTGFDIDMNTLFSLQTPSTSNLGFSYQFDYTQPTLSSFVVTTQDGTPFTMDDLTLTGATAVPEPGTLALVILGFPAFFAAKPRRLA